MTVFPTMSRGPVAVRNTITSYLKSDMPTWLDLARAQWGLDESHLPNLDVEGVFDFEREVMDRYPMTVVAVSSGRTGGRVDQDDLGAEAFRTLYNVRLYTYVKAALNEAHALQMRDDYATVLRWCLVSTKSMRNPDFEWQVETLSEDYSVAIKVGGDRWVGAVTHSFTARMDEHNVQAPLGSADVISIDAGILQ